MNVAPLIPVTASLKVAVMLLPTATPVALTAGVRAVTVGATLAAPPVVKDHVTGASARPVVSVIPAKSRAVYTVFGNRLAFGFNVAVWVVALYVTALTTRAPVVAVP